MTEKTQIDKIMNLYKDYKEHIKLNKDVVLALKELFTENNLEWFTSGYDGKRFGFKISNEWYEKNEYLFVNDVFNFAIEKLVQMICACTQFTKDDKKRLNLSEEHIALIRRCSFKFTNNDYLDYYLILEHKRPFGNSDILGDLCDYYKKSDVNLELLDDVINKIKDFLIGFDFDEELEGNYISYRYVVSESYLRKRKIEKFLEEINNEESND